MVVLGPSIENSTARLLLLLAFTSEFVHASTPKGPGVKETCTFEIYTVYCPIRSIDILI